MNDPVSRLQTIWKTAAFPKKRSLTGGIINPTTIAQQLKQPIVLSDTAEWSSSTITPSACTTNCVTTPAIIYDSDTFADISEAAYGVAVDTHMRLGLPLDSGPLNPEQRASGRDFLKVAKLRKDGKAQGFSTTEIRDTIHRLGLDQVTMMIGKPM